MKTRSTPVLTSAILLSLLLASFVPGSISILSTWLHVYFPKDGYGQHDVFMMIGFSILTIVALGLTVLWTGYRQQERAAWFAMLALVVGFVFPCNVLPTILSNYKNGGFRVHLWVRSLRAEDAPTVHYALGVLTFLAMLLALFIPVRAFFGTPRRSDAQHSNG